MNVKRRLALLGVMLVVLSMTMATQYATTKITYRYSIVHPSESDIRFIGSDNSSDGWRILRIDGTNGTSDQDLKIELGGNISADQNKTYTAAFGIVNEEEYNITITHINVSAQGDNDDYMQIWLHGDRSARAEDDATSVFMYDGTDDGSKFSSTSSAWGLYKGDQDSSSMDGGNLATPWDYASTSHVRYSIDDTTDAANNTDDYVWVQISLDIPPDADSDHTFTGVVYVHTRSTTTDD